MLITSGDAPMTPRSVGASSTPTTAMIAAAITPSAMPCTAASAAASGFFSPMRRATIAVTPIDNPIAAVYTSVSIDSVRPTVATALGPRCATQNTSTTANTDSMTISSTIGTASRMIARPIGPEV